MAIVAFRWSGTAQLPVSEELLVGEDGTAWLWSLVPEGLARLDRGGTFRANVGPDRLAALQLALGAALSGAPREAVGRSPDGGTGASATGIAARLPDGRVLDLPAPPPAASPPGTGPAGSPADPLVVLASIAAGLRADAEANPVSAVRIRWWPLGPVSAADGGTAIIRFESIGEAPIALSVGIADLRLVAETRGAPTDVLIPAPGAAVDVMAGDGRLLGGESGPVRLGPGEAGNVAFIGGLRPAGPGPAAVHARFSGRITLAGPARPVTPGGSDRPGARVAIASPSVEVTVES
jgi:hypothetical protein